MRGAGERGMSRRDQQDQQMREGWPGGHKRDLVGMGHQAASPRPKFKNMKCCHVNSSYRLVVGANGSYQLRWTWYRQAQGTGRHLEGNWLWQQGPNDGSNSRH